MLGQLLCRRRQYFADARVVELGCGAGLAGVVASRFARYVLFTDGNPNVLPLATTNAVLNGAVAAAAAAAVDGDTRDSDGGGPIAGRAGEAGAWVRAEGGGCHYCNWSPKTA